MLKPICLALAIAVTAPIAAANVLSIDNGVANNKEGHLDIGVDDYGSYGHQLSSVADDGYYPVGAGHADFATWMAGIYVFVTTPSDNKTTAVLLTDDQQWINRVEYLGDGISGDHALTRSITSANTRLGSNEVQSAFKISGPLELSFGLHQILIGNSAVNRLEQTYTIDNTGGVAVDLVFHVHWDTDLMWDGFYSTDVVGVGPGQCYVYAREPGPTNLQAVALANGGSTVAPSYYYAGKVGVRPGDQDPAYASTIAAASAQHVWINRQMPTNWRNHLATVGYDQAGESSQNLADYTSPMPDAHLGLEYRFSLAAGEQATIRVHRHYGTISLPCPVSASCGDGNQDPNEACDSSGVDTTACNGAICTTAACGDNYFNAAANEDCDSGGVDTGSCNGSSCSARACGDGYVNIAAGEQCDSSGIDSDTCNAASCTTAACGDGYINAAAGESCETAGTDTATCDAATCTAPVCGDGYLNLAAGEQCDDGADTPGCNLIDCKPPSCGDGYVNAAAEEQCEAGDPLCDPATCSFAFSLGGGCAGCGAAAGREVVPYALLVAMLLLRRRRRPTT